MGTKITHKSLGHNPHGDNRMNLKSVRKVDNRKGLREAFSDPSLFVIYVTDHEIFAVDKLKYKRKRFLMIEPNPVTFYYSVAYDLIPQIEAAKQQLELFLSDELKYKSSIQVVFSYVFKVSSIGIIFSFLALEAFMNQRLPDYAAIEYKGKLVTKSDIQRWATFEDKLLKIIPKLDGRNFCELYPNKAVTIKLLKTLRDELTHLKQKQMSGMPCYNQINQDILNLNLKKIVFAVKSFINFYQPKLIQNYKRK